jgi:phosphatidylinositol-3-phosphatase
MRKMTAVKVCAVVCLCLCALPGFAGVTVSSPGTGVSMTSPIHFVANGKSPACSKGVAAMGIYTAPSVLAYVVKGSKLDTKLTMKPGQYNVVVQHWDHCGWSSKQEIAIHVASTNAVPHSNHVWIITEENHSYEKVIGNSSMPYYNSLANKYALATQYYANRHSSLPALMWLVAGQDVTTNNNTTFCFNVDNVVRHLLFKGMTWKSYQEDLPHAGFTGLSWANYVRRHNPLIDFTDVCAPGQKLNSVPYKQLATDMANEATPNYIYITPNLLHDGHDGTRAQADTWLSNHVPKILARPEFQAGGDGLLFIAWDEGNIFNADNRCSASVSKGCGGRVATLVIGPKVKHGFKSQTLYHHENLLRTVCDALGFASCPGAGATAKPMLDFF